MAEIIVPQYGQVFLDGGFNDEGLRRTGGIMALQTEAVINFFRDFAVIKGDIVKNMFGLYSYGSIGKNGKMRFGKFKGGNHLWQKRQNGCLWNPKGRYTHDLNEVTTSPIEVNLEICPDALWESCWEKIMEVGRGRRDLFGNAETSQMMGILLDLIYRDLGDGFYDISWFGKHPLIDEADSNNTYNVGSEEEWEDYKDQQDTHPGFLTYVDYYKYEEQLAHFNVPIHDTDINGADYIGDPTELFERLQEAAPPNFKLANDTRTAYNGRGPMILVTGAIFKAYKNWLINTYGNLPEMFYYQYNGEFCRNLGCAGTDQVPGVLKYDGIPVIRMSEWDSWANMLGIPQHRAMLVPPGMFGLGWDVDQLNQYTGMGLMVYQRLEPPFQGKIFMDSLMRIATALVDTEFISSATKILK